jgi:ADP-ribose pyrophosphatase YjhB (NUDIX family)
MDVKFYKYCALCKADLKKEENSVVCPKCGFAAYNNEAACASSVPVKDGKVLLCVRKFDPFKGKYDLIGGFINPMEHPEKAAVRETLEETQLKVETVKLIGIYPDIYGEIGQPTLNFSYLVKIIEGEPKPSDDAEKLEWFPIKDLPRFKVDGFKNTEETLKDLYELYLKEPELFV